jgi:hypothetical protein
MVRSVGVEAATAVVVVVVNVSSALSPLAMQQLLQLLQQRLHSQARRQEWLEHLLQCRFRILPKALGTPLHL